MRKLTMRERVLLIVLAVIVVISGYVLLFYLPMRQSAQSLQAQIEENEELSAQLDARLTRQRQMEHSVAQWSEDPDALPEMPSYDNQQAVMVELNSILSDCLEYSLSFQTDDTQGNVFRRTVTIPFVCANYTAAENILQRLHDSALRSHLSDVQIAQQEDGTVHVTAVMTFFEYQDQPAQEEETGSETTETAEDAAA